MTDNDKQDFVLLLTDVLAFYRQDVSRFAASVWWEACKGFDLSQLRKAFNSHAIDPDRGQFAPKPADIVRALHGTRTDQARVAWGKTFDAMQRVGAHQTVVFDDHIIHACVEDIGGWQKICRSNMDELSYLEHRFCESYRAYASRGLEQYPAKLIGEFECINRHEGKRVAPPVLIGNAEKARQVLELGSTAPKTQFTIASDALSTLRIGGEK